LANVFEYFEYFVFLKFKKKTIYSIYSKNNEIPKKRFRDTLGEVHDFLIFLKLKNQKIKKMKTPKVRS
jgi:hypothetical protein